MEHLVEWMLVSMGAPAACITPIVGATILAGWAQNLYQNAKESAEQWSKPIWYEFPFILSLILILVALSWVWTALKVLFTVLQP